MLEGEVFDDKAFDDEGVWGNAEEVCDVEGVCDATEVTATGSVMYTSTIHI